MTKTIWFALTFHFKNFNFAFKVSLIMSMQNHAEWKMLYLKCGRRRFSKFFIKVLLFYLQSILTNIFISWWRYDQSSSSGLLWDAVVIDLPVIRLSVLFPWISKIKIMPCFNLSRPHSVCHWIHWISLHLHQRKGSHWIAFRIPITFF